MPAPGDHLWPFSALPSVLPPIDPMPFCTFPPVFSDTFFSLKSLDYAVLYPFFQLYHSWIPKLLSTFKVTEDEIGYSNCLQIPFYPDV